VPVDSETTEPATAHVLLAGRPHRERRRSVHVPA